MKKYSIEQFPKNKTQDLSLLSKDQKKIRKNAVVRYEYGEYYECRICSKSLPIAEFYVKDKITGRRSTKCRDCQILASGVVEIGKVRYAKKIFKKGFRRCSVCKDTKPLSEFSRCNTAFGGFSNNCSECQVRMTREYVQDQKRTIGKHYLKQYGKSLYGLKNEEFTEETYNNLKKEIEQKRSQQMTYFLDGKEFTSKHSFGRHVEQNYGVKADTVVYRLQVGYSEQDCTLSENEAKSKAYTKGRIKVTDTITNEVFYFRNTMDPDLLKMFSTSAINRGIKSGTPTRVGNFSKYKSPCLIERIIGE